MPRKHHNLSESVVSQRKTRKGTQLAIDLNIELERLYRKDIVSGESLSAANNPALSDADGFSNQQLGSVPIANDVRSRRATNGKAPLSRPSSAQPAQRKKPIGCQQIQTAQRPQQTKSKCNFICTYCASKFTNLSRLQKHCLSAHAENPLPTNDDMHPEKLRHRRQRDTEAARQFVCNFCNIEFSCASRLEQHRRRHTGEKPYMCSICGLRLSQSGSMRKHMRTHSDARPFRCTTCDARFTHPDNLATHQLTHSRERPFMCHECPKTFISMDYLRRHERVHSGKNYVCEECGKRFIYPGELRRHSVVHDVPKPFSCGICHKRFSQSSFLDEHCCEDADNRLPSSTANGYFPVRLRDRSNEGPQDFSVPKRGRGRQPTYGPNVQDEQQCESLSNILSQIGPTLETSAQKEPCKNTASSDSVVQATASITGAAGSLSSYDSDDNGNCDDEFFNNNTSMTHWDTAEQHQRSSVIGFSPNSSSICGNAIPIDLHFYHDLPVGPSCPPLYSQQDALSTPSWLSSAPVDTLNGSQLTKEPVQDQWRKADCSQTVMTSVSSLAILPVESFQSTCNQLVSTGLTVTTGFSDLPHQSMGSDCVEPKELTARSIGADKNTPHCDTKQYWGIMEEFRLRDDLSSVTDDDLTQMVGTSPQSDNQQTAEKTNLTVSESVIDASSDLHPGVPNCDLVKAEIDASDYRVVMRHVRRVSETTEKRYLCQYCNRKFRKASRLYRHTATKHKVYFQKPTRERRSKMSEHDCPICSLPCGYASRLAQHMRRHTHEKPVMCPLCGLQLSQSGSLRRHMRTHSSERPHECRICSKRFAHKNVMLSHERTHTEERPYSCSICAKSFVTRDYLHRHEQIHAEGRFVCSVCDKRFTWLGDLQRHERKHTGAKPFKCDVCEKRYSQPHLLTLHRRLHSGTTPFSCETCGKQFALLSYLRKHATTHMTDRYHVCAICGKQFKKEAALARHMDVSHGSGKSKKKPYPPRCKRLKKSVEHVVAQKKFSLQSSVTNCASMPVESRNNMAQNTSPLLFGSRQLETSRDTEPCYE